MRKLIAPLLEEQFRVPDNRRIDLPLLGGAVLFGLGWGIAGFCPGPALVGLVTGATPVLIFVGAMLAGMLLHRFTLGRDST